MKSSNQRFDEQHVIHELKHYLPTQTPLKDFIHHNSLHAFQEMNFYDAIFKASEIFGFEATLPLEDFRKLYQTGRIRKDILEKIVNERYPDKLLPHQWMNKLLNKKYENPYNPRVGRLRAVWKATYQIDLDNLVQPLLFRILSSYLDQGIALWHFPFETKGLLFAIQEFEKGSYTSFFKSTRVKNLLFEKELSIEKLLKIIVGKEEYYEQYLFDQQFSHRGWSGMVATIEDHPDSVLYPKKIAFKDLLILDLLFEIDALDTHLGSSWKPITEFVNTSPLDLFQDIHKTEYQEVMKIWQDAFEWSYYDEVLAALKAPQQAPPAPDGGASFALNYSSNYSSNNSPIGGQGASFQAIFCIDEREDSLRRHVESCDKNAETLGCPGFFGVEFYFQPQGGQFYEKLCPAPVTPKYLIKEYDVSGKRKHELLYTKHAQTSVRGFFTSLALGGLAAWQLVLTLFRPKMSPAISNAFAHMNIAGKLHIENFHLSDVENGLQVGFTIEEMATRVENLLRGIGMIKDFAPLVYVVAHGSSSANNPHHGAHDCGACSGRPGSVNARVFAYMANDPKVRAILDTKGLRIPEITVFIGALHDTAADEMAFYDDDILVGIHAKNHSKNKQTFENALDLNAKERSRRFASIDTNADIKKVRNEIRKRSVSLFEPRPELGHGTNALCFVGRRSITKNLFLDRRAFMNSYDYRTDPEGNLLLGVIRPVGIVCGGINLEYYFSRVDNYKLGAGTKLPHNVVGLIGVANSSDGDLRPGLPLQMIEVHDPVRLLVLMEHYPEVVLKTVQREPAVYEWYKNGWVHLVAIHPDTNDFYYYKNGKMVLYRPMKEQVNSIDNMTQFIERAKGMVTNHIVDATKENLEVQVLVP
jgi:uncharacterized protein